MMEDALATAELHLGRDDPRLAPVMVDLATVARHLGNLTEARAQLRRAYAIVVAASGPEHPTSLSVEGRLAAVTHRLGEPTEAYDWHLTDVGLRVLGPEHPAVRGAQQRLARTQSPPTDPHIPHQPVGPIRLDLEDPEVGPVPTYAPPGYEYDPGIDGGHGIVPATDAPYDDQYEPGPFDVADTGPYAATEHPGVYERRTVSGELEPVEAGHHIGITRPAEHRAEDAWSDPATLAPVKYRGNVGGKVLVGTLGAAILIAAVVIAVEFFRPELFGAQPIQQQGAAPTPAEVTTTATPPVTTAPSAPTDVRIKDEGGSVTLTWIDPSDGTVAFIVTGAREGEPFQALDSVPAGRTSSVIYGLNTRYNYCFTVSAVWAPEVITPSSRTCTNRLSTSSAP